MESANFMFQSFVSDFKCYSSMLNNVIYLCSVVSSLQYCLVSYKSRNQMISASAPLKKRELSCVQ